MLRIRFHYFCAFHPYLHLFHARFLDDTRIRLFAALRGHACSPSEVKQMRGQLPSDTTLILDEAYIDFSPENVVSVRLPNSVQIRTLSKAFGLAVHSRE
jgi:hypothetical protein